MMWDVWHWLLAAMVVVCTPGRARAFVCYANQDHPCSCYFDHQEIDMTFFDDNSKLSTRSGSLYFQYNPCRPFQCSSSDKTFMICMHDDATGKEYGLGRVTDYVDGNPWNVTSLNPLTFTIQYYDGDEMGSTSLYSVVRVEYKENRTGSKFIFVNSTSQGGNQSDLYEFVLRTPYVFLENTTGVAYHADWIPGAVFGSWVLLVLVLTLVVLAIICVDVSRYKRKIRREEYQPIPNPPPYNDPDI